MSDGTHLHHDGLPYNQVRDLVAAELRDHSTSTGFYVRDETGYRDHLVRQAEKAQRDLVAFDRGRALWSILDRFGWTEHDVSDRVGFDPATYRSFIGTDEEFARAYPQPGGP